MIRRPPPKGVKDGRRKAVPHLLDLSDLLAVMRQEVVSGQSQATDWRDAAYPVVRAMPVVMMHPATEHGMAVRSAECR
jgi:hypothetical protein